MKQKHAYHKRIAYLLICVFLGVLFFGQAVIAAPGDQVRIEFRYSTTRPSIPETLVRTGLSYRLVEARDPVVEYQRPLIRETPEVIIGYMKEAELASVRNLPGVKITPVDVTLLKETDVMKTVTGLPTNDVEDLDATDQEFARAGVRFEVEAEDEYGLPTSYKADIFFRGLIQDHTTAYYKVERTLIHEVVYGYENQYMIVAIYEEQEAAPGEEVGEDTIIENLDDVLPPLAPPNYNDLTDQNERNVRALEEINDSDIRVNRLGNVDIPTRAFDYHDSWSIANVVLTFTSLVLVMYYVLQQDERELEQKSKFEIRFIGIILGGVSLMIFFLTQQIKGIMVIFDFWSIAFTAIVVLQVVIVVISRRQFVKVRPD